MSLDKMISIVTPSFNQSAYLGQALESVRNQRYTSFEHIILDGGSTDGSVPLLEQSAHANAGNLSWRSHPDAGQSAALNEGFQQAKGDIIGWLNADDRYRPDCFAHVAQAFARNPEIDIVYGDYTLMQHDGQHLSLRREIEFSHFILKYHRVCYIPTTSTFFRRRVFDDGNQLRADLHYAMDLEFFIRLAGLGYRFHHLPRTLADFRLHPESKSVQFRERHREEHRQVVLQSTPLAHLVPPMPLRNLSASLLQLPAAALRYSEKLLRGYYLPLRNEHMPTNEESVGAHPS
jgi:glycosyltransferase involved in cell wall biosynthesis